MRPPLRTEGICVNASSILISTWSVPVLRSIHRNGLSVGTMKFQEPRRKCKLLAYDELRDLLGFDTYDRLRAAHRSWVHETLKDGNRVRDAKWRESLAVGSEGFVESTKEELGIRAIGRKIREMEGQFELRVSEEATYHSQFEAKKERYVA